MKKRSRYANLRAYVDAASVPQGVLAKRLGIPESSFSQYVNLRRIPEPSVALKLARRCGVSLASLLKGRAA